MNDTNDKLQKSLQRLIHEDNFLSQSGWFLSMITELPVNKAGAPIPWFTYSGIAFIEPRVKAHMNVLEFGCGQSTLWWSSRIAHITSVEHEYAWYQKIKAQTPENVDLNWVELVRGGEYSKMPLKYQDVFDIVVIDGRDRVNCSYNVLQCLKKDGIIIWDNSDRTDYIDGYDFLHNNGFKRIDFISMGPCAPVAWGTSIFYRNENCFGI